MARAIWNGSVIAESDATVIVEGNHYFPSDSIRQELFRPTETTTVCPWKGTANYFSIDIDGEVNRDSAWAYNTPKDAAAHIKDYFAFWRGVTVEP